MKFDWLSKPPIVELVPHPNLLRRKMVPAVWEANVCVFTERKVVWVCVDKIEEWYKRVERVSDEQNTSFCIVFSFWSRLWVMRLDYPTSLVDKSFSLHSSIDQCMGKRFLSIHIRSCYQTCDLLKVTAKQGVSRARVRTQDDTILIRCFCFAIQECQLRKFICNVICFQ